MNLFLVSISLVRYICKYTNSREQKQDRLIDFDSIRKSCLQ